jgi:hypothetical protein
MNFGGAVEKKLTHDRLLSFSHLLFSTLPPHISSLSFRGDLSTTSGGVHLTISTVALVVV